MNKNTSFAGNLICCKLVRPLWFVKRNTSEKRLQSTAVLMRQDMIILSQDEEPIHEDEHSLERAEHMVGRHCFHLHAQETLTVRKGVPAPAVVRRKVGSHAYRVGAGDRRRRRRGAAEGEEEAPGGVGGAGGPVHRARPRRVHPRARRPPAAATSFVGRLIPCACRSPAAVEGSRRGWGRRLGASPLFLSVALLLLSPAGFEPHQLWVPRVLGRARAHMRVGRTGLGFRYKDS